MTREEAEESIREYREANIEDEELFSSYMEALTYLAEEEKDGEALAELGGNYYEMKDFNKALYYYEEAEKCGYDTSTNLGYIWYYGRTGEVNYEKAYYYFKKASDIGDNIATYKLADMYKNGYYVEKDYKKYKEMISSLIKKLYDKNFFYDPFAEVALRYGDILYEEGKEEDALSLYKAAKFCLSDKLKEDTFFGNLINMKRAVDSIWKIKKPEPVDWDLFDLFQITKTARKLWFTLFEKRYYVVSQDDGTIFFKGTKYNSLFDMFSKYTVYGKKLVSLGEHVYNIRIQGPERERKSGDFS